MNNTIRKLPSGDFEVMRAKWFCPVCNTSVPSEHVTFSERHDERCGRCGEQVTAYPYNGESQPISNQQAVEQYKTELLGYLNAELSVQKILKNDLRANTRRDILIHIIRHIEGE